jgi:outer membrane protein assembly factor BamA
VIVFCCCILWYFLTGLVSSEKAGGRVAPRVADFEQRLGNRQAMKLFRRFVVCGTHNLAGYAEQCAGRRFLDFVTTSDEAFALLVLKNNEAYLNAVLFSDDASLATLTTRQLKRELLPVSTATAGLNSKDNGE